MNEKSFLKRLIFLLFALQADLLFAEEWNGSWFPYPPNTRVDPNPTVEQSHHNLYDEKHGTKMGIKDSSCDDGKTKLEVDWDNSPLNYTCYAFPEEIAQYKPRSDVHPILTSYDIPQDYSAQHYCMKQPILYNEILPTFGSHRPLWAKWGEYKFLPRQRWLHNLEHGGIVMLYHPCADKNEVKLLKSLVNNCLYRHIITPYSLLTPQRSLALLSWGHSLEISKVDPEMVVAFIRNHALRGPEQTSKDGQYDLLLEQHAEIVTDKHDKELCGVFGALMAN